MNAADLHVIAVISNPVRYQSRYDLYRKFAAHMLAAGVKLVTVEIAYAGRPFEITDAANPYHVRLRSPHEIWHKENMINVGIQHLARISPDWQYCAWIDADVTFLRPDWAAETVHQLQHHQVVQLWSTSVDTGPKSQVFAQARSFGAAWLEAMYPDAKDTYRYRHTGYAWGARRSAIDTLGGLLDFAPLGSADFYMAWAFIQQLAEHLYQDVASAKHRKKGFTPGYIERLMAWQEAAKGLKMDLGVVEGTIAHGWHGKKKQRAYNTRENILIDNAFDPAVDLRRDWQGVWQLVTDTHRQVRLRDGIRAYLRQRNEDSIDME